ncbi:MAG: hypothetical protein WBK08_18120 [Nitrospira sp.]|nr:MAG: hypothetical protein E8D42_13195 [Nitrospira sp.]
MNHSQTRLAVMIATVVALMTVLPASPLWAQRVSGDESVLGSGFESGTSRVTRQAGKVQELVDKGLEIYDMGEKAASVTTILQRIQDTDRRINELKDLPEAERGIAEKNEMAQLVTSLKDDVRSLGSGSVLVSTLVDQLKAKLPILSGQVRAIEVPPKADFSFLKQTAYEAASANPAEACAVVTRLAAGKQGITGTLTQLEKTIEALNGVHTRLTYAEDLVNKVWALLSVPVVNIPIYGFAPDLYELNEAIGPVIADVADKRRQLERARDFDKKELAARTPEIDRTLALYQAKHKADPCQATAQQAKKAVPPCTDKASCPEPGKAAKAKQPPPALSSRTVQTLIDPCLSYTITSRSASYVNLRIENTCERETVKVEHACTSIGLKPICTSCDNAVALWGSASSKTCAPGK